MLKIWDVRIKVSEEASGEGGLPRIVRLSRKLKLTKKETSVMIYVLCCQVCVGRSSGLGRIGRFASVGVLYGSDTLSVCKACDMKISEMVEFLNLDREHMKQGLFPDVQQSYLLHSALGFDEVSCKALVGAPLKANEFLKIEQTPLADVIAEEAGNEHLRSHEIHLTSSGPVTKDDSAVVVPEGGVEKTVSFPPQPPDVPSDPEVGDVALSLFSQGALQVLCTYLYCRR